MSPRPRPRLSVLRQPAHQAPRLMNCARCRQQVVLCRECDHGNRYCSEKCAAMARRQQMREAGRRYQLGDQGRLLHRERQRRYRQRQLERGSAQGSPSVSLPHDPPGSESRVEAASECLLPQGAEPHSSRRCDLCGALCSAFVRRGPLKGQRHRWRLNLSSDRRWRSARR